MSEYYECPPPALLARTGVQGTDFSYLIIVAYECKGQMAFARADNPTSMRGEQLATWKLLVSSDLSESINHSWGKYEAMSGKLQELIDTSAKAATSATSIATGVSKPSSGSTNMANVGSISGAGKSINSLLTKGMEQSGVTSEQVKNTKLDASVVYQDSTNRQFNIELEFVCFENAQKEVYEPIRALMKYSCATARGAFGIKFPAIFSLLSSKGGVVDVPVAALVAVQPTWMFPWKDGYPMQASVTLSFTEIPPLYRQTMDGKSIVSSSSDIGLVEDQYRQSAQKG